MSDQVPKSSATLRLNRRAKIGVVTSRFNEAITFELRAGALAELDRLGVSSRDIHAVWVPGAYEIPLAAKWLLTNRCDGVIALGAVVRGETPHFDYVCAAVERGCTLLQLEQAKPVVFGVLTVNTDEQARERIGGKHGHKGREAASTLIEMLNLKKLIKPHRRR